MTIDLLICPCCKRSVQAPSLDIVIEHCKLPPMQARVLGTIWKGKGRPVPTDAIIAAMDRGIDVKAHTYTDFKIALHHLRRRVKGAGIAIPNAGYARGYFIELPGGSDVARTRT